MLLRTLLPAAVLLPALLAYVVYRAEDAGAFGTAWALVLFAGLVIIVFCALIGSAAVALDRADARLRESHARELAVAEATIDGVITMDADGRIVDINRAAERTFGYRREDAIGRELAELVIPPAQRAAHRRGLARHLETGESSILGKRLEMTAIRADGSEFPVELMVSRIEGSGPAVFAGSVRDITSRREGEEATRRLASVVESSADAIIAVELDGRIASWNAAAERLYGYTAEEVVGRVGAPIFVPYRVEDAMARFNRLVRSGERLVAETVHIRKDGSPMDVAISMSVIRDATGAKTGISMIIRDITERREREREVRRLAAIVESSRDAIMTFERDGTIIVWNEAAADIYGYSAEEIVGRPLTVLSGEEGDRTHRVAELVDLLERGEQVEQVAHAKRKDGTHIEVSFTAFPIRDESGEMVAGGLIARDVTERRRLQEQLRQAQKMEAVGQLAGGIAHDFNNLLTVISGYGDIARRRIGAGPGAHELQEIEQAAARATQLTRQLLAFSRQQVLEPEELDLNEVSEALVPMLSRLIGEDIDIAVVGARRLPRVLADRGQIEQVIVNLAVNARDAMPSGGTLTIETRALDLTDPHASEHAGVDPGHYVCLSVTDTGSGMDAGTVEHIFEPFFTTKGVGRGTGLGLATVHGIVRQSGGRIGVYSEPGLGTTFKIYLPVSSRGAERSQHRPEDEQDERPGNETILLCEDEDAVRALVERVLTGRGYKVLSAATPDEALELARRCDGQIAALVSDVVMPQMPGPELAKRLHATTPGLPTLFLSGYTPETIDERGSLPAGSAFLEKPFDTRELLGLLRDLLDRTTAARAGRRDDAA